MRLADFILKNVEPILVEWEAFARTVWPEGKVDSLVMRDHAADILRGTALDMRSSQTATQQSEKSKGTGGSGEASIRVDGASDSHAVERLRSGFKMTALVAEYRALRASVVRLWRESLPEAHLSDLDDLTRFNESIDQSLTEAVRSYTEHVDKARQMFLAILGHDLRNPLSAITLAARMLPMTGKLEPPTAKVAAQISTSASAMGKMISDLLDFTASGLGASMPLSPTVTDLGRLCQDVIDEMRSAHPQHSLHYEQRGDLMGTWDTARLRQVVSNLVGNAVQHGGPASEVNFAVSSDVRTIQMAVRNAGTPIPAEMIPTIFEPLVRGTSPEQQKYRRPGSIGLGLYIAREVVVAHGGRIDVQSSADAGTMFTVSLPRQCVVT